MAKRVKSIKSKPLISIITPSFNSGNYIEECIKSVLNQDYSRVEQIIQDGNSNDQTKKILSKYQTAGYMNKIRIFIESDKGQSDGLNKAIQKAKGDILLVLNADDALMPYACSWAVENIQKYPEFGVVYGDNYVIDERSEIVGVHGAGEYSFERLLCVELVPPAQAAFIRRSALEKVGFWADSKLDTCPDYEMWVRITMKFPMKHVYGFVTRYRIYKSPQLDSKAPRTVDRFVAAKREVMDRVFNSKKTPENIKNLRRRAYAGLESWASTVAFQLNEPRIGYYYLLRSLMRRPTIATFVKLYTALGKYPIVFNVRLFKFWSDFSLKINKVFAASLKTSFEDVSVGRVQNFWDERPCNIRHSKEKIGTKKYFDDVEKRKYFVEPHIPKFAEFYKWKGKKVLEIGCGIGTDTVNFARAGAMVTAIEISKKSLDIARKRAKVFGLEKRIKFYLANAEELSKVVPIKPYDLIYSFGVIHHTPHPHKVIEEIRKYTHGESVIKIMIYNRYSWKVFWILLKYGKGAFWRIGKLISQNSEAAFGSPVTYTYSKRQAKRLLKPFEVKDLQIDHIFPYCIPEYRNYQYKKVWYFRFLPVAVFRFLENNIGWHLLITAIIK